MDWIELDWTGLDWIGLDWTGLDWTDQSLKNCQNPNLQISRFLENFLRSSMVRHFLKNFLEIF